MRAVIVDDEPRAIQLLSGYLEHFDAIELAGTFRNGMKALEFIAHEKVDLIFLDINMPHLSGMSLSKMLPPDVKVIFTTAYSEYAVESYDIQAVDYLLKPISLERFTRAVSKVLQAQEAAPSGANDPVLLVKSGTRIHRVNPADIRYLKSDGNYLIYHLDGDKIMARESILQALDKLPSTFIQTHKSYIVNTRHVSSIDKDGLDVCGTLIPIGAAFKEHVNRMFRG